MGKFLSNNWGKLTAAGVGLGVFALWRWNRGRTKSFSGS